MKTLAHTLIQLRYVEGGATTRFVVLPIPDSGLPRSLVDAGRPVPLDLLTGRPVNLKLDEEGLEADLCFEGPPVHCRFPWEAVVATQDASGELVQTLVVTVATVMEDSSLRPTSIGVDEEAELGASIEQQSTSRPRPHLQIVPNEGSTDRS